MQFLDLYTFLHAFCVEKDVYLQSVSVDYVMLPNSCSDDQKSQDWYLLSFHHQTFPRVDRMDVITGILPVTSQVGHLGVLGRGLRQWERHKGYSRNHGPTQSLLRSEVPGWVLGSEPRRVWRAPKSPGVWGTNTRAGGAQLAVTERSGHGQHLASGRQPP